MNKYRDIKIAHQAPPIALKCGLFGIGELSFNDFKSTSLSDFRSTCTQSLFPLILSFDFDSRNCYLEKVSLVSVQVGEECEICILPSENNLTEGNLEG